MGHERQGISASRWWDSAGGATSASCTPRALRPAFGAQPPAVTQRSAHAAPQLQAAEPKAHRAASPHGRFPSGVLMTAGNPEGVCRVLWAPILAALPSARISMGARLGGRGPAAAPPLGGIPAGAMGISWERERRDHAIWTSAGRERAVRDRTWRALARWHPERRQQRHQDPRRRWTCGSGWI